MQANDYNAKLVGYVHEGNLDVRAIDEVTLDAFYDIYEHGRQLWDNGDCSKYVIAVVADTADGTRMVGHVRPDMSNFEDSGAYEYLVEMWYDEPDIALFERNFGGFEWNQTYERIFEQEYEFPIAQA